MWIVVPHVPAAGRLQELWVWFILQNQRNEEKVDGPVWDGAVSNFTGKISVFKAKSCWVFQLRATVTSFEMFLCGCRSNLCPENSTKNSHDFQMHCFEGTTSCRACSMLLRCLLSPDFSPGFCQVRLNPSVCLLQGDFLPGLSLHAL